MKKIVNGVEVELNSDEIVEQLNREFDWTSKSKDRLKVECERALDILIERTAQQKGYTSAITCASYALSTNEEWKIEAELFIKWRDICYEYAFEYQDSVIDEVILNPSVGDFLAGVPVLSWQ